MKSYNVINFRKLNVQRRPDQGLVLYDDSQLI